MYRCHACDTPAQMNCACFTQMECPNESYDDLEDVKTEKVNIASGEDANCYVTEYA